MIVEIEFSDISRAQVIFGELGENLKSISKMLGVEINQRGSKLFIKGEEGNVRTAEKIIKDIYTGKFDNDGRGKGEGEAVFITYKGKGVYPKNEAQRKYIKVLEENDIVFCFGPAGTGKTYLSVAVGVKYLKKGVFSKIVISRPAVEAGEKIGFLPGSMEEKVEPFLRPIYDTLYDILDYKEVEKSLRQGVIEIVPIAFMRGRTFSSAFVIIDEAQNITFEQLKMVLTRLGANSKMVITADLSQIDIPQSGLQNIEEILRDIEGISFFRFSPQDTIRHRLVSKIIERFEDFEKTRKIKN